jgi:hypothetical protein
MIQKCQKIACAQNGHTCLPKSTCAKRILQIYTFSPLLAPWATLHCFPTVAAGKMDSRGFDSEGREFSSLTGHWRLAGSSSPGCSSVPLLIHPYLRRLAGVAGTPPSTAWNRSHIGFSHVSYSEVLSLCIYSDGQRLFEASSTWVKVQQGWRSQKEHNIKLKKLKEHNTNWLVTSTTVHCCYQQEINCEKMTRED